AMQAELAQGVDTLSYRFIKRKRVETYEFAKQPGDNLKIGNQSFETDVVFRQDQDKDKSTKIWVIPTLDYQVGQIQHTDDGDTYQIRLADYQGDSAKLQQLYTRIAKLTPGS